MSRGQGKDEETYDRLLETVKPRAAEYLREKFQHWMDHALAASRRSVEDELDRDAERLLVLRTARDLFSSDHISERTGYSFVALHPGIEYAAGPGGPDGWSMGHCDIGAGETGPDTDAYGNPDPDQDPDPETDTDTGTYADTPTHPDTDGGPVREGYAKGRRALGRNRARLPYHTPCDVLLRGQDGSSLFLMFFMTQSSSPAVMVNRVHGRIGFLREHLAAYRRDYGVRDDPHIGVLLPERVRSTLVKALDRVKSTADRRGVAGSRTTKGMREPGTNGGAEHRSSDLPLTGWIPVIECSLADGTLTGPFPGAEGSGPRGPPRGTVSIPTKGGAAPTGTPFGAVTNTITGWEYLYPRGGPFLDLRTHEYLLFEGVAMLEGYARRLMEGYTPRAKEFTPKELLPGLFRETDDPGGEWTPGEEVRERRRAFARKHLNVALETALRYRIIEGAGDDTGAGAEPGNGMVSGTGRGVQSFRVRSTDPYRFVCHGTALTVVRNNLRRKYIESRAAERVEPVAKRKAVEAYRRRFPRIDSPFR